MTAAAKDESDEERDDHTTKFHLLCKETSTITLSFRSEIKPAVAEMQPLGREKRDAEFCFAEKSGAFL